MGYWGEITATIDWCEENYVISHYAAEWWNTISSLIITVLGVISLIFCLRNRSYVERRFALLSLTVIVVGLGSAAFHGTLRYHMQMLDELPMIYAMTVWLYIWMGMQADPGPLAIPSLVFLVVSVTVLHVVFGFVVLFQLFFGAMVFIGWAFIIIYARSPNGDSTFRTLAKLYVGTIVFAWVLWMIDQHFCSLMRGNPIANPQLHAWWHFFVGFSCYYALPLALYMRLTHVTRRAKARRHALVFVTIAPAD